MVRSEKGADGRRGWGDDSKVWNEQRQRWVCSVEAPPHPGTGHRRRLTKTVKLERDCKPALKELREKAEAMKKGETSDKRLRDYLDEWMARKRQTIAPSTYQTYRSAIEGNIKPHIGAIKLCDLKTRHVAKMDEEIVTATKSIRQAQYAHRVLSTALADARRQELITYNVAGREGPKPPSGRKRKIDYLNAEEAIDLLKLCRSKDEGLFTRWAVALNMGLRQGEALGLQWDRVDLNHGVMDLSWQLTRITFEHGCGKQESRQKWPCGRTARNCPKANNPFPHDFDHQHLHHAMYLVRPKTVTSERFIEIPDHLLEHLRHWRETTKDWNNPHNLVWCKQPKGIPIGSSGDHATWVELLKEAGLPRVQLRSTRHTAATLLYAGGMELDLIKRVLGHTSVAITTIYTDVDKAAVRRHMNQLSLKIIDGEVVDDPNLTTPVPQIG